MNIDTSKIEEKIVNGMKKNKRSLVRLYGKNAENVMYERAKNIANKNKQNMEQRLKEIIKGALKHPISELDAEAGAERYEQEEKLKTASIALDKLESLLKSHDWYYMMSDDSIAYDRGLKENSEIKKLIMSLKDLGYGEDAKNLYNQYRPERFQAMEAKKVKKSFPDLTGDDEVTKADILKGRGIELKENTSESGLIVVGRTPLDNNAIGDAIEEEGLYGEWNPREGYWFFPEEEEMYDALENQLSDLFNRKGINARFEGAFSESVNEDLDLGHTDDEPNMIKGELYKIGKYAMELYQMVDQFDGKGEVDFPHWWQAKIVKAATMISSAKHYLEFELSEPKIDAVTNMPGTEEMIDEKMTPSQIKKRGKIYDALKAQGMSDEKAGRIATATAMELK
jgi:hypothetical protein